MYFNNPAELFCQTFFKIIIAPSERSLHQKRVIAVWPNRLYTEDGIIILIPESTELALHQKRVTSLFG